MSEDEDFTTCHILCTVGVTAGGVRTVYKHADDCARPDENVAPRDECEPRIPPQDTTRDMWLLATPPIGQVTVNSNQYEELRILANKLAVRAATAPMKKSSLLGWLRRQGETGFAEWLKRKLPESL